ncbi:microcin [Pantoea agglomerans]|nr:microcin [Pantoea agglomerans]PEI05876.1 microcin [Pantoea agglomerans]
MRELNSEEIRNVAGAGTDNPYDNPILLMNQIAENAAWGAALGAYGGPEGVILGAGGGVVQTVVQGAAAQMPVNVPIPQVPLGPTWNGSGSN